MIQKKFWGFGAPLLFFVLVVAAFLAVFARSRRSPHIESLSHLLVGSGEEISIYGNNFGKKGEGSRVSLGGMDLSSVSVLSWSDKEITIHMPRFKGTELLRVRTRTGSSQGVLVTEKDRFPQIEEALGPPGAPFLAYADPPYGGPGTLVTLRGERFGKSRQKGRIWVNHRDTQNLQNSPGGGVPHLAYYVEAREINLWTDKEIRFWLPGDMSTGSLYLSTDRGFSNPLRLERDPRPGRLYYGESQSWSLSQRIEIDQIGALPGNSLYLWMPQPDLRGRSSLWEILNEGESFLRRFGSLSLHRLDELVSGETRQVERSLIVEIPETNAQADPHITLGRGDLSRPALSAALGTDSFIQPERVARTAARVAGTGGTPYTQGQKIYRYVLETLSYHPDPPSRVLPDYLDTGLADAQGYSFLFCSLARAARIPARAVGGFLLDEEDPPRPHWWAEIWLEGMGWFPVDPALGDQMDGILFPGITDSAEYYWGSLDSRHLAFSRGLIPGRTLQPQPDTRIPQEFYTLQDFWEEASGNLETYRSRWSLFLSDSF